MAIVVVGANGKDVGKTELICGLIAALPEFAWTAVKITDHPHGRLPRLYEERSAGPDSDTSRYLAAGARRAFLMAAGELDLAAGLDDLWALLGAESDVIFESNRVLSFVQPDLCLAIEPESASQPKPSFRLVEQQKHGTVRRAGPIGGQALSGRGEMHPVFSLANFSRIPPPMREWLRARLPAPGRGNINRKDSHFDREDRWTAGIS